MAGSSEVWAGGSGDAGGSLDSDTTGAGDSLSIPGPQFFTLKNRRGLDMALLKISLSSKLALWLKVWTLQLGKLKFEPWLYFSLAVT